VPGTVVIGLGSPLMGDDGLGLAALAALEEGWAFDPPPIFLDGGTWGMNLLPDIEDAGRLLLLDAVAMGRSPGTVIALGRDDLPRFFSIKLSPHQVDLREVLALAELRGTLPEDTVVLGLQPDRVELTTELSDIVRNAIPHLVDAAVGQLTAWGHVRAPGTAVACTS